MKIFAIDTNRFATGTSGKLATYVVAKTKGRWHGVRGRRPMLDDRYKPVAGTKVPAEARDMLKTALEA